MINLFRTYLRTLTKLGLFNPGEILIPQNNPSLTVDSSSGSKLYTDLADNCPHAKITPVQKKYFNEAKGIQAVKHLVAKEFASVELQLQHKFYR